ncbi:flagellar motor switch phosphatase FliY [Tuberibacillus sp. Marseille-P3662]|uniref:flagellar motor switch phosphatase FliY n=1 Tax=Tuberibacillus sp. Marseille-P3662 TaxID=1965358 RepID=UPI000A1CE6E6|nr:flagellar motor switch phosphatase FliY [Tuberibacillus sp. Marseille-P3662]
MSDDGMLSQEEIDALLGQTGDHEGDQADSPQPSNNNEEIQLHDYVDSVEIDTMGEIGNIAFGNSATALSSLLNQKVEITTPSISLVHKSHLQEEFPIPYVSVKVVYTEGFEGTNVLVIKTQDASVIADLMLGGDGSQPSEEMNDIHLSAVEEAMNQMMGSAATSMSTIFNRRVDISPPKIDLMDVVKDEGTYLLPEESLMVKVSFNLKIGQLVDSDIMQLIPLEFAKGLVNLLITQDKNAEMSEDSNDSDVHPGDETDVTTQRQDHKTPGQTAPESEPNQRQAQDVQSVAFSNFDEAPQVSQGQQNLNLLMDVPLKVTVELGRTKQTIRDVLNLSPGSIVELDKLAGEPVDILVNDKPVAKGEVVVIDENFGVRVTEILNQYDRIHSLK